MDKRKTERSPLVKSHIMKTVGTSLDPLSAIRELTERTDHVYPANQNGCGSSSCVCGALYVLSGRPRLLIY